jgi:hypothetical protein
VILRLCCINVYVRGLEKQNEDKRYVFPRHEEKEELSKSELCQLELLENIFLLLCTKVLQKQEYLA